MPGSTGQGRLCFKSLNKWGGAVAVRAMVGTLGKNAFNTDKSLKSFLKSSPLKKKNKPWAAKFNTIVLMHDYFTHSKFTTELRLRGIFKYLCHLRVVFMAEKYFFHLCCFRNLAKINFQFAFSKRGVVAKFACLMSSCMGIICWPKNGQLFLILRTFRR